MPRGGRCLPQLLLRAAGARAWRCPPSQGGFHWQQPRSRGRWAALLGGGAAVGSAALLLRRPGPVGCEKASGSSSPSPLEKRKRTFVDIADGEETILAADCGGTTTRLLLYTIRAEDQIVEKETPPGKLLYEAKYPNILFKSFEDVVEKFFEHVEEEVCEGTPRPTVAVLAIAGIVNNNRCRYTNLDWVVNGDDLAEKFDIKNVEVINDFVAQGYGVLTLKDNQMVKLHDAPPRPGAPIAVIGAGTGLGTCFLSIGASGEYEAYASEGGHIEFAPRGQGSDDLQIELLKHLKVRLAGWNRISVERVVSGRGICNVYEFLAFRYPERVDKYVHSEFLARPTDASIVATNAWPGSLCEKALQIFAACYGGYCGSMAIIFMPFRGVYLTGGVTMKLAEFLETDGSFMDAYRDKGRMTPMLSSIPLFLTKGEDMGQRGAHLRAVRLLKEYHAGRRPVQKHEELPIQSLVAPRELYGENAMQQKIAQIIEEYHRLHGADKLRREHSQSDTEKPTGNQQSSEQQQTS